MKNFCCAARKAWKINVSREVFQEADTAISYHLY